jgi:hypothetical protein
LRHLSLVFPNPYQSLVTVTPKALKQFTFSWHVLAATEPFKAVEPKGPALASVLPAGMKLYRQTELRVSHGDGAASDATDPIAYFSPFPNGYDQVIAMTFDDIPFETWVYPRSGHDPNARIQKYLIRLLEDHPDMKMGWIILLDSILSETDLGNPDYTPGQWWTAHGPRRILTHAPLDYLKWLRTIDQGNVVYGYEARVRLGSHGYHHTPEMLFGNNWEFQSYDPVFNDSTFSTIVNEYNALGLGSNSRRWIRFPGFYFTRATVDALIKYGWVLFDYWGIYDKLPWMLFYSEQGHIWGIGTYWEGDTPQPYSVMDKILGAGQLCHTAGHPYKWFKWFDGDPEAAYAQISQMFRQAEENYPNLGYMFPDEVGLFANETYELHGIETAGAADSLAFSFFGSAESGQTIVVEWPTDTPQPASVTIDGQRVRFLEHRGSHLVIILPQLADGEHVAGVSPIVSGVPTQHAPHLAPELYQNVPNPVTSETMIRYRVSEAADVDLAVYNVLGEKVAELVEERKDPGTYEAYWNGRDAAGREVASGVYFYRLNVGDATRVRKLTVVR